MKMDCYSDHPDYSNYRDFPNCSAGAGGTKNIDYHDYHNPGLEYSKSKPNRKLGTRYNYRWKTKDDRLLPRLPELPRFS